MEVEVTEVITTVVGIVGVSTILWYIVGLARVIFYERNINKTHDFLERSRKEIKKEGLSVDGINARMSELEREWLPKLEKMKRKRRFILDKLPFIRR
ncbi:MAG: hypothetical protein G01um101430_615 [Parcubacteria group bacterium Gr01-1014_30]|nr:MAG: hypothetical protein G01um101430_615 [Parcubacteria group bacterium Gr01-1014_30]